MPSVIDRKLARLILPVLVAVTAFHSPGSEAVTPRYPGVGLDSTVNLTDKIVTARVFTRTLVVAQR